MVVLEITCDLSHRITVENTNQTPKDSLIMDWTSYLCHPRD